MAGGYPNLKFNGTADNYDDALDIILERLPAVVFLEINPENLESRLSLHLINEVHRFLKVPPRFIVTTESPDHVLNALRHEAFDYLLKPLSKSDFRKAVYRLDKTVTDTAPLLTLPIVVDEPQPVVETATQKTDDQPEPQVEIIEQLSSGVTEDKPLIICVKSYGDYRFIHADDICYLQADNNSTDIHLNNGEMITAFKTLKHFENVLSSPFVRIHNSYIVNIDYVSRIHTGNSVCYIKNTATKLPFSKSYKENVDAILTSITKGNYLEI